MFCLHGKIPYKKYYQINNEKQNKTKQHSTGKSEIETLEVADFASGHSQYIYINMYEKKKKCKQIIDFLQEKFKNRHQFNDF